MTPEDAATVALRILAHLVGDDAALERFIALTGYDSRSLARNADDPALLAGVLDYYLGHEGDLIAMCEALDIDPSLPAAARRHLPDGGA